MVVGHPPALNDRASSELKCLFGWKADRPLSEMEKRKRTFVQTAGQGAASPFCGGERKGRFPQATPGKRTFVLIGYHR